MEYTVLISALVSAATTLATFCGLGLGWLIGSRKKGGK